MLPKYIFIICICDDILEMSNWKSSSYLASLTTLWQMSKGEGCNWVSRADSWHGRTENDVVFVPSPLSSLSE